MALGTGCVRGAVSVAQPTALERQLLGDYEELDADLIQASSTRGAPGGAPPSFDMIKAQALQQRAIQRFNEDDLLELKTGGCIAETLQATVVGRACKRTEQEASAKKRAIRVVEEENRARRAILAWAAGELARSQGRAGATAEELAEIRKTYQKLIYEAALPGQLVERTPGKFEEVKR